MRKGREQMTGRGRDVLPLFCGGPDTSARSWEKRRTVSKLRTLNACDPLHSNAIRGEQCSFLSSNKEGK